LRIKRLNLLFLVKILLWMTLISKLDSLIKKDKVNHISKMSWIAHSLSLREEEYHQELFQ